ncbi:MAG: hypothetical protein ACFCVE_13495 [Phycisphaerae bacterium]
MRHAWLAAIALGVLGGALAGWVSPAAADVVTLRDGTQLSGEVEKVPGGWRVTSEEGVRTVASADVAGLRFGNPDSGETDLAMQRVERLRKEVQRLDDLGEIIELYRRLAEQDLTPAAHAAVEADLTWWLGRQEVGATKYGHRWLTGEERRRLAAEQLAAAREVRRLIQASELPTARAALNRQLEQDPLDVSAHYLMGVVHLKEQRENEALLAFSQVARLINDHAPTLNNLAVLNFRRGNHAAAREQFEQALIAAPLSRSILDNVAEAMNRLETDDDRRTSWQGSTLARRFAEQDAALQTRMAGQGLFRWGSGWVDQGQLTRLENAALGVEDRLGALQRDFDITAARIERIDESIERARRTMRTIEQQRFVRDPDGSYRRLPHPPAYYDLLRDIDRLRAERAEEVARIEALREAAAAERQDQCVTKFGRELTFVLEDGVPVVLPADERANPGPATVPSTAASTD